MKLRKITLENFRNFKKSSFAFNPFLTIIIGENARGKTNLLEAIYFVVTGRGFRESRELELLNFEDVTQGWVEGVFVTDASWDFKIVLLKSEERVQKSFFLNRAKKRHSQYQAEQTRVVLFTPVQIEIITGSPEKRRSYVNHYICTFDPEYKKRLDNYEQALRKRNKILERHGGGELDRELEFWNDFLEEQAAYLSSRRQEHVDFLNKNPKVDSKIFHIVYLKNEFTKEKAREMAELEKKVGRTMMGPQKDDFQIELTTGAPSKKKNIHHFGSRSEQRLAVLWLKLNEIKYFEELSKKKPILLFDDVFSELDTKNRKLVLDLLAKYQTIVTTTEKEILAIAEVPKTTILV